MFNQRLLSRRDALKLGFGFVAGVGVSGIDNFLTQRNSVMAVENFLKNYAAAKGLLYGSSCTSYSLKRDSAFASVFAQECDILVPDLHLKWSSLRPSPDEYNFTESDWLAEFAKTHNMLLRGHTLVWQQALPEWLKNTINKQNAEQLMVDHIQTVVGRYAGQMHSWDVVNEVVNAGSWSERSDGLDFTSPWYKNLGKSYIDTAFRAAAEADPQALLVCNERQFSSRNDTSKILAQREALLGLLEYLKSIGTPIHALGIQAHLDASNNRSFEPKKFRKFLSDVASLGLKILISEMDVRDKNVRGDIETRDRIVAEAYEQYLSVALDEPAVIAVITWGLSDRYSRYNNPRIGGVREDGGKHRPLPLDRQLNRKLAWYAVMKSLEQASKR